MREADDDCFAGAAVYVDTKEAVQKTGDLLGPLARGVLRPADVLGTPGDLARQQASVFKSVGTALEDLAAAVLVFETVVKQ